MKQLVFGYFYYNIQASICQPKIFYFTKNTKCVIIDLKVIIMLCKLCPRKCQIDRSKSIGFCKSNNEIKLARCARHMWEEPPISGTRGSGTIFFTGCNLHCSFCQNEKISDGNFGKEVSLEQFCDIILRLQDEGVHNINFVTPTHFADKILMALDKIKHRLNIPVIYNCGGYESEKTLNMLNGYIDIYIPDFKYFSEESAKKYSNAPDYFKVSKKAIQIMISQVGKPLFDANNIMLSGVIIRHLILPGLYKDSIKLLQYLNENYNKDMFLLSLMSQFTPNKRCENIKELNRKITTFEYNKVADFALKCGFDGFFQNRSSAKSVYTPPFDLTGI